MPALFHRVDDSLVEILPTYSSSMPMSGKYVVDFPDHFDLKLKSPTPTRSDVIDRINLLFREKFVSFDYFITNNFLTKNDFNDSFEVDPNLSISFVDNNFLPVSSSNEQFNFKNSFKKGNLPNTLSVVGRFPQKNHIEDSSITSDRTLAGNRCVITKSIDISGSTSDQQGRTDFFLYFRSCLKSYVKDRSLSDTERNETSPKTQNRTGLMSYTNTQYDSDNRLRCFISGDNGGTYQEIKNLKVFTFNGRVDSIKLAWVNYTDADLTLLSYTLMY